MTGNKNLCHMVFVLIMGVSFDAKASDSTRSQQVGSALQTCLKLQPSNDRLECYDLVAKQFAPPTFKGRLGYITDPFTLTAPHKLRYRSYGVIFVLYLRNEKGDVLQNLHIGGGGESEYIIKESGTYSLKIHGSTSWEIWLEPLVDKADRQQ